MKTNAIKKLFISFIVFMIILTTINLVSATNDTNDAVKFSIKSKFLNHDKNWNTDIVRINITIDRLGRLIYIENYYTEGSTSLKFQSSNKYFDDILINKSISFNISRPTPGGIKDRRYTFLESIILFDNKIIFNKTVNLSNRYKLDYSNISSTNKSITKINSTKFDIDTRSKSSTSKNLTNNKTNYTERNANKEKDYTLPQEKTSGFQTIITVVTVCILYMLRFRK